MGQKYNDIDKLIKDICGPDSKFYKDWMKAKEKRTIYKDGWLANLSEKIKESKNETDHTKTKTRQGRKRIPSTPKRNDKTTGTKRGRRNRG